MNKQIMAKVGMVAKVTFVLFMYCFSAAFIALFAKFLGF